MFCFNRIYHFRECISGKAKSFCVCVSLSLCVFSGEEEVEGRRRKLRAGGGGGGDVGRKRWRDDDGSRDANG